MVLPALVHEFQHLINAGRRIYVNSATSLEEVWLNEGLSHIAEELLYYSISGNAPKTNIGLPLVQSTQAQLDAANTYQLQNFLRLHHTWWRPRSTRRTRRSMSSRCAARSGSCCATRPIARAAPTKRHGIRSSTRRTTGQSNFNAVFGNITTSAHDWSIAQLTDDAGLSVAAKYTNPSWNFRSMLPPLSAAGAFRC